MAEVPDGDALEKKSLDSHSLELLLTVAKALIRDIPEPVFNLVISAIESAKEAVDAE